MLPLGGHSHHAKVHSWRQNTNWISCPLIPSAQHLHAVHKQPKLTVVLRLEDRSCKVIFLHREPPFLKMSPIGKIVGKGISCMTFEHLQENRQFEKRLANNLFIEELLIIIATFTECILCARYIQCFYVNLQSFSATQETLASIFLLKKLRF